MNKIFFSAFLIYVSAIATPPTEQKYPLLESCLANESVIKQICLSNLENYPDVCNDCNAIEKIFTLNRKGGLISTLLKENEQKKTSSLFSFSAKIIYKKKMEKKALALERECNALCQEASENVFRLLSAVSFSDQHINFDDLLAYEGNLIHQGLINAARNVSIEDEIPA